MEVEDGIRRGPQKADAAGELLQHRADHGGAEQRIVPGAEPGRDALRTDADAVHGPGERGQRMLRKLGRVLLAGEAFLFVVADDPRPARGRDLDQRNAGIVHAPGGDAGEVDGLAPFELGADALQALGGKIAVQPVDMAAGIVPVEIAQRGPKARFTQPAVARSGPHATLLRRRSWR